MKIFALTAICVLVAVCSAQTSQTFINQALKAHNDYRAKHGAQPLKISSTMNAVAQKYATKLAALDKLEHSTGSGYGENLAKINKDTGEAAVILWYNEVKNYDFATGKSKNGGVTGHFTQVVWKGSKELGIAMAKTAKGQVIVVANYSPPGNYGGRYLQNVSSN